jgi:HTH-type transcriptional regulator/antitoxin HigA
MNIQPIRTEEDHKAALAEIERLWSAAPGSPDEDKLDVLATLVEVYETKHYPIPPPDPIEAIIFRMEQEGLGRGDLEIIIGSRARVSEILNRVRPLTLSMMRRLNDRLHIPMDILTLDYPLSGKKAAPRRISAMKKKAR